MDEAGAALMAGGSVAAVAAAAAGANALAPEAKAEAEALLECLSELLPILGEALEMTTKVEHDR